MEKFSAIFICVTLILIIFLSLWFFTPIVLSQSLKFYSASQQVNFIEPLQKIFPSFFASEEFSAEVGSILNSFVVKSTNSLVNSFANVILNFPTICLQLLVVFVTFFFVLRDKEKLIDYIKSLLLSSLRTSCSWNIARSISWYSIFCIWSVKRFTSNPPRNFGRYFSNYWNSDSLDSCRNFPFPRRR